MLIFHLYFIHLLSCIHQHHFMVTISSYWHRLDAAGITDRPHRGFQDVSWNKNTPTKSSIYRWIFHDKPSIFGISPDIPPPCIWKAPNNPINDPWNDHWTLPSEVFQKPSIFGLPQKNHIEDMDHPWWPWWLQWLSKRKPWWPGIPHDSQPGPSQPGQPGLRAPLPRQIGTCSLAPAPHIVGM